ncbi:substrate-binding domain-containing protein [Nakamurella flavida]|uniref:Substrate-binding domain-containing protein n=1 Tax=Nakamurella flavida TaxID=363630 RepID=A0A939C1T0_9ACTN|nr:substrate-binding domain-containing protein [Nakamurella flavida]MBM9475321.1 substrate-binding domain-containing protein [Nakamurella flavida]MDP9776895.1 LacI family transcriptional regulator [Nakamurella flavida]
MGRPERTTLDAVAAAAGVSKATASKVLNDRDGVSDATRQRVLAAMKRLRYEPSTARAAGSLHPVVTVLFDAYESLYAAQVLAGVVAAGLELDIDVVTTNPTGAHRHDPLSAEWFHRVADKGHVGVIVVTTEVSPEVAGDSTGAGLGLVLVDPVTARDVDDDGLVSVSATNWTGGYQATEHLIALGHRRIGFAGGPAESQPARQRLHGHVAALSAAGLANDPALTKQDGFRYEDGRDMAAAFLDLPSPPTAIVASCDAGALGVIAAARDRQLRLPQELSIIGFDDTYAAESASPRLTTIHQPLREMGRLALRTVLAQSRGQAPEAHHYELVTSLIVRDSTAPPPGPPTA